MTGVLLQFAYLGAIGFSGFCMGWLLFRGNRNPAVMALAACEILIVIWCVPQLFLAFPLSLETKFGLYAVSYLGISLIGPCWFRFSCLYSERQMKGWAAVWPFLLSGFDYVMFLSNGYHHLFYSYFGLDQVVYGPVFYFHMVCTYVWVILGMAVIVGNFRKNQVPALHVTVILLAAAVPLGFNVLYLSGLVKSGFDLTPPVFALSSFLMLLAVFRYDFLDVNVLAFQHVFDALAEGVIVYNRQERVTYCNEAAKRFVSVTNGESRKEIMERLKQYGNDGPKGAGEDAGLKEIVLSLPDDGKVQVKQYFLSNKRGEKTAGILLFTDVGEYYKLLWQSRELAVSRQHLAIEQERNRIAQEVHDTTGHTLTMIQSLIKLIGIEYEKGENSEEIREYLSQARQLAGDGIRELRWAINHMRQGSSNQLVTQGVCQLTDSVKELEIEVEIQGEDSPKYSYLSEIVYSCLREAITNCLKYAKASHMDVIVKFGEKDLNVYIFDNGCGCDTIHESHGLTGIRDRITKAGGQARFFSAHEEGFQIFLTLPVTDERKGESL